MAEEEEEAEKKDDSLGDEGVSSSKDTKMDSLVETVKEPVVFDINELPKEVHPSMPLDGKKSYTITPLAGQCSMQVLLEKRGFQINKVVELPMFLQKEYRVNKQGNVLVAWRDDIMAAWTMAKAIVTLQNLKYAEAEQHKQ